MTEQTQNSTHKSRGPVDVGWLVATVGLTAWPLLIPRSQGAYEGAKRHYCFLFADAVLPLLCIAAFIMLMVALLLRRIMPKIPVKMVRVLLSVFIGSIAALVIYNLASGSFRYRT